MKTFDIINIITARLCHDISGLVSASLNGFEIYEEDDDPEFRKEALAIVSDSLEKTAKLLYFSRICYSQTGPDERIKTSSLPDVIKQTILSDRIRLKWEIPDQEWRRQEIRLLFLLLRVVVNCIMAEATLRISLKPEGGFQIMAKGRSLRCNPDMILQSISYIDPEDLGDHPDTVMPYLAGRVAEQLGYVVNFSMNVENGSLLINASPSPNGVKQKEMKI